MARVHNAVDFALLIKELICSLQEGCMKPGDKLLAVNGESVLGYSVEKVSLSFTIFKNVGLVYRMFPNARDEIHSL